MVWVMVFNGKEKAMKTKVTLLMTVMLLLTAGLVQANWTMDRIDGTFDLTYHSAYMWRGFDVYHGKHGEGAINPSVDLQLGNGFGLYAEWVRANTSGFEKQERLNATLYYGDIVLDAEPWETDYKVGYTFFNFPNNSYRDWSMNELFAKASMPQIIGAGVTPYLGAYYAWNTRSGGPADSEAEGWMGQIGVGYDYRIEGVAADIPAMDLNFYGEVWYNSNAWGFLRDPNLIGDRLSDGLGHDWSHYVLGVTTEMPVAEGWNLEPGLHYQHRLNNSLAESPNVLWATMGLSYEF